MCTTCDERARQDDEDAAIGSLTDLQKSVWHQLVIGDKWMTSADLAACVGRAKPGVVRALNELIRLRLIEYKRHPGGCIIFASKAAGRRSQPTPERRT